MTTPWWQGGTPSTGGGTETGAGYALDVADYGALGDGVTDDAAAIRLGIADAILKKKPLLFQAGRTYAVASEIAITSPVELRATVANIANGLCANLRATPATAWTPTNNGMRSVLKVAADGCHFVGINCEANRMTKYAWFIARSSFGRWSQCGAFYGRIDGFHSARYQDEIGLPFALNDTNHFEDCWAIGNGRIYTSDTTPVAEGIPNVQVGGTVSTTSGSTTITFADTDFDTLSSWLRWGDFIAISTPAGAFPAAGAMYLRVADVAIVPGSNQIVVGERNIPNQTLSGREFIIGQGGGYWPVHFGDNNVNRISGGLYRLNGGCGLNSSGLVGAYIENPQVDFNGFFGIVVGPGDTSQTYASALNHPYLEANYVAHLLFSGAYGVSVTTPEWGAGAVQEWISHGGGGYIMPGGLENLKPIDTNTRSEIASLYGYNLRNTGKVSQYVGGVSTTTPGTTISYDNALLQVATGGDVAYTGTPTLQEGTQYGEFCTLWNVSASYYTTIDDHRKRAGTKLRLKTPSVKLGPSDSITLMWDETYWTEIRRSIVPVVGDSTGTPGNATINETQGRSAIAAAATTCTITNSQVGAGDVVLVTLEDLDATAIRLKVAVSAGSFVVTSNAAATATTKFSWRVVKDG